MSESKTSKANSLYAAAESELRDNHRDEFQAILERLYSEAGLVYKRRLSPEEREAKAAAERRAKARERAEKMAAEFGADLFEGIVPVGEEPETAAGF